MKRYLWFGLFASALLVATASGAATATDDPTVDWSKAVDDSATLVERTNDTIFAATEDTIYAIDRGTAEVKWDFTVSGYDEFSSISVITNSTVFVEYGDAYDLTLYALDRSTGNEHWSQSFEDVSTEWQVIDEQVVAGGGSYPAVISAYDIQTGNQTWSIEESDDVYEVEVTTDSLYAETDDNVVKLDTNDGTVEWRSSGSGTLVTDDERIGLVTADNVIDDDFETDLVWYDQDTGIPQSSHPLEFDSSFAEEIITSDGTLFATTEADLYDYRLYTYDLTTNEPLYNRSVIGSSISVSESGEYVATPINNRVQLLNGTTGTEIFNRSVAADTIASVSADSTGFSAGTISGTIYDYEFGPTADINPEQSLSNRTVEENGTVSATITATADTDNLLVSQEFEPALGDATLESVTVNGNDTEPTSALSLRNGTLLTLENLSVGDEVVIEYTLSVGPNATGEFELSGRVDGEDSVSFGPTTLSVDPDSPAPTLLDEPARDLDDDGVYEDVNGDGTTDIVDVAALFRNQDAAAESPDAFDFNGDGTVNIIDVNELFRAVV